MSERLIGGLKVAAVLAAVSLGVAACENGSSPTGPSTGRSLSVPSELAPLAALGTTAYPGVKVGGQVKVCKDAASPAGSYHFHVTASPTQAGDLVPSTGVTLSPGQCQIVWERPAPGGPITNVNIVEEIPNGATYRLDHIIAVDDGGGTRNVAGPGVTVQVKGEHGAVATFYNVPLVNFGLGQATYPGTETPGQAKVCKHASSPAGVYTFNITASGTVAGDQVAPQVSIMPGQCAVIFIRTATNASVAVLTVTEVVPSGMTVTSIVKLQFGSTTTVTGTNTTTVSENVYHGGVLTFTNAFTTSVAAADHHHTTTTSSNHH